MLVEYGGQFSDFWSALKNPRTGLTCGFSKSSKGTWEPGLLCNHWHWRQSKSNGTAIGNFNKYVWVTLYSRGMRVVACPSIYWSMCAVWWACFVPFSEVSPEHLCMEIWDGKRMPVLWHHIVQPGDKIPPGRQRVMEQTTRRVVSSPDRVFWLDGDGQHSTHRLKRALFIGNRAFQVMTHLFSAQHCDDGSVQRSNCAHTCDPSAR